MSATDDRPSGPRQLDDGPLTPYQQVQRSPEFRSLRKRWRGFIFAMSALFLGWFLVYAILAGFYTEVVNETLGATNLTVGLILGLLQFVSTFVIATVYVRFADRNLDPEAERLRLKVEENL